MKKIISTLAIFICALIPAVMFTSCLDNDDEGKNQILTSNFVTYEGMRGGKPVFTYVNPKTQANVTLTGDLTDLKNVNEGDRCFLTYYLPAGIPDDAFTDSQIKIMQLVVALTARIEEGQAMQENDIPGLDLNLRTMYVNGYYLNLLATSYFGDKPEFKITYVPESIETGTAEIYIVFNAQTNDAARDLDVPASFNIAAIWNNPNVTAINVHLRNSNSALGRSPFLIKKAN